MEDHEVFHKNLERWTLFCPVEAKLLSAMECKRIFLVTTGIGSQNLQIQTEIGGEPQYFHFPDDPIAEAKQWFSTLDLRHVSLLYVYGVGLGYYYDPVKEWLSQNPSHYLIFLEDDLEVIHRLFETEQGAQLLHDKQVLLQYFDVKDPLEYALRSLSQTFCVQEFKISALQFYVHTHSDILAQISTKLSFWTILNCSLSAEYANFGQHFFINFYQNLLFLPNAFQAKSLFGKFSGVPAIICGAGPSLDKNLPLLETLGDRALIFAGGTALNAVNSRGFLPHFGLGIDPNEQQLTRLIMNKAYEIPFFFRSRLFHDAFRLIQGNPLYVTGSGGHDISDWFEKELGIEGKKICEGFNVVNFSLSLAHALGCNPIIFVGLDLAYTNRRSYQSGVSSHPTHLIKKDFRTKGTSEELLLINDIYGNPTYTLWKWVGESSWYSQFAHEHPEVTLYNATEGGLGMPGIPNVTLKEIFPTEVVENPQKRFDFRVWTHGEIQNAHMPSSVTPNRIRNLIDTLTESLKQCLIYCKTIESEYRALANKLEKEEVQAPAPLMTEKAKDCLEKLSQEIAYTYVLYHFRDYFNRRMDFEFKKLSYDAIDSSNALGARKADIQANLYKFLADTATVNLKIIQFCTSQDISESIDTHRIYHELDIPPSAREENEECYSFENQVLTIVDPELHLSIQETIPAPIVPASLYYPDGTIKLEQFYLENHLHGPVTFFDPDGAILARSWYVRGVQQGKTWLFYDSKNIYSIQRFHDGKLEGIQEYYFRNGNLKTTLNYRNGLLHGEVLLRYVNGKIKRVLHFSQGLRQGSEKMWDSSGTLLIEVEYDHDRPVGTAKKWHPNGILSQEISYDANFLPSVVKQWDEQGISCSPDKAGQEDYFDAVTKQTNLLTLSLDTVFEHLNKMAPQSDMEELKHQLDHLHEMNEELLYESGLLPENLLEPIWKTPTSQRIVQQQVEDMTNKLAKDIAGLHDLISQTVLDLSKRKENEKM